LPMPPGTRRIVFTFPSVEVQKPVLWELGRKFPLVINIMRGDVSPESGWQVCEIEGSEEAIAQAAAHMRERGIWVDPGGIDPIDHDRAEVV
ncbi:MAG: NIL domain-containing protein, partial [Candidatus Tectomicrobia bacterium]|nr:NIL domain-containing protein [Candidatus Tectomicrobia bacterium]